MDYTKTFNQNGQFAGKTSGALMTIPWFVENNNSIMPESRTPMIERIFNEYYY